MGGERGGRVVGAGWEGNWVGSTGLGWAMRDKLRRSIGLGEGGG